jgi:hypothetical protein
LGCSDQTQSESWNGVCKARYFQNQFQFKTADSGGDEGSVRWLNFHTVHAV